MNSMKQAINACTRLREGTSDFCMVRALLMGVTSLREKNRFIHIVMRLGFVSSRKFEFQYK